MTSLKGDFDSLSKKCLRCGYEWLARVVSPLVCPKCGSRNWNKTREEEK